MYCWFNILTSDKWMLEKEYVFSPRVFSKSLSIFTIFEVSCIEKLQHEKSMSLSKAFKILWSFNLRISMWLKQKLNWSNPSKSQTAISRCVEEVCVCRIHSWSESDCVTEDFQIKWNCSTRPFQSMWINAVFWMTDLQKRKEKKQSIIHQ